LPSIFDDVLVPPAVRDEVLLDDPRLRGITELKDTFAADWLRVQTISPGFTGPSLPSLGEGESQAITLMLELGCDALLIDDRRGREYAMRQGLPVLGTIGILRLAREDGLIEAVSPLVSELRSLGFRVSAQLIDQIRDEESQ
jgi:predicted nucleic acid-binding protein